MKSIAIYVLLSALSFSALSAQTLNSASDAGEAIELSTGVSGEVAEVLVQAGDTVNQDELLLRLNDEVFKARVNTAKALLELRKSQLGLREQDYERQQELYQEGSLSKVDLQRGESSWLEGQYMLAKARSGLLQAQQNLDLSAIYAPVSGEIIAIAIKGQRVNMQAGNTVLVRLKAQ